MIKHLVRYININTQQIKFDIYIVDFFNTFFYKWTMYCNCYLIFLCISLNLQFTRSHIRSSWCYKRLVFLVILIMLNVGAYLKKRQSIYVLIMLDFDAYWKVTIYLYVQQFYFLFWFKSYFFQNGHIPMFP